MSMVSKLEMSPNAKTDDNPIEMMIYPSLTVVCLPDFSGHSLAGRGSCCTSEDDFSLRIPYKGCRSNNSSYRNTAKTANPRQRE